MARGEGGVRGEGGSGRVGPRMAGQRHADDADEEAHHLLEGKGRAEQDAQLRFGPEDRQVWQALRQRVVVGGEA